MFLAHFMGDIHQPLHVSFADDEGGNSIIVHWYRRKSNLHHVSKHLISFIHTPPTLQVTRNPFVMQGLGCQHNRNCNERFLWK